MTINVNIPKVDTASFQPDFTKTVEFSGFTLYHSLKERYFITPGGNPVTVTSQYDPILDSLDIVEGFAYLIGGNTNHFFTAQCESGLLGKTQVNPATGNIISEEVIDIGDIVEAAYPTATETFITSGYVNGNTIILGVCTNPTAAATMEPKLLLSTDNALTWTAYDFTGEGVPNSRGMPIAIVRINFGTVYYYWILHRSQTVDNYSYYLISEEDLLEVPLGTNDVQFFQTSALPNTHNSSARFSINVQAKWNDNAIYFLNDTREIYYELMTNLHSGQYTTYVAPYPIEPFVESVSATLAGERYTHLALNPQGGVSEVLKVDEVINNASSATDNQSITSDQFILWNKLDPNDNLDNLDAINIQPYSDDVIALVLDGADLRVIRGEMFNSNLAEGLTLNNVPLDRFNTPGFHNGVVVDPLPATWLANDATSQWISDRADTDTHDYGGLDFDYSIVLSVDLPLAVTGHVFRFQYYGEILDIRVEGVSTGQAYSGTEGTWVNATVNLPRGPADIQFDIRNPANPGPGNPTGIRVEFDNTIDLTTLIPASGYSDIFVDETEDRLYVSFDTLAWVCELSTLSVIYAADIHAEQLVLNPPYPPGWDPLAINGVTDDTHNPVQWKFLKNFNDVYIYNTKHADTYTNLDDKEFYLWEFRDDDPTGIQMFSAFLLDPEDIAKIQYFEDVNTDLHIMVGSTSPITTTQYRLNGLAQFNQINTSPVEVGPIKFSDVLVGINGHVYVSEGDDPGHTQSNNALFVYENSNSGDIDNGSYLIAVAPGNIPYDYDGFTLPSGQGFENFGLAKKYVEIPGDYTASFIIGSIELRNQENDKLSDLTINGVYLGGTDNPNAVVPITSQVIAAKMLGDWTYSLMYDTTLAQYRIYRARAVYYPYT